MNSTISVMSGFSCTSSVFLPDSDGAEEPRRPPDRARRMRDRAETSKLLDFAS